MTVPFPAQAPEPAAPIEVEAVVVSLRRHGRHLLFPVIVLVVVSGGAGFWVGALAEPWMNWAAGVACAAIALLLGVGPVLSWLAARATVTSRRVILRRGLFVQHRSEVPLIRVREVRARRGPLQRLFGSGDIVLLSGPEEQIVLPDVPGHRAVADAVQELIERNYARAAQHSAVPQPGVFGEPSGPDLRGAPQMG